MPKTPLSVTLDEDNILWLRGRTQTGKERSLSEALNVLVTSARQGAYGADPRSVTGTVDISPDDPDLLGADAAIQALIDGSVAQPLPDAPLRTMRRVARRG